VLLLKEPIKPEKSALFCSAFLAWLSGADCFDSFTVDTLALAGLLWRRSVCVYECDVEVVFQW
jgi:hypothetical protein